MIRTLTRLIPAPQRFARAASPRPLGLVVGVGLLTLALGGLGGCRSATYARMPSEREVEPIASLVAENDRLPHRTTLHNTTRDGEPDIRVAIHEVGTGDKPTKLVLIHGVFTDSEAWRYVVPSLADAYDLWLIDTPGCGASDAPSPSRLGEDGYGPEALADRMMQALQDRFRAEEGTPRLELIAHSLGGAIAIRMLADPRLAARFGDVVGRIDNAVLLAPLNVSQNKADSEIIRLATVGGLTLSAGDAIGYVMEQCAVNTIRGFGDPRYAVREEADKRYEILTDGPRRKAMQAQLLQAVPFDDDFRPVWDEMDRQTSIYPNLRVPTLIVWGARDEVLPVSAGYQLQALLPDAKLVVVPGVKHSVQLERPIWTAEAIRAFVQGLEVPPAPSEITMQPELTRRGD